MRSFSSIVFALFIALIALSSRGFAAAPCFTDLKPGNCITDDFGQISIVAQRLGQKLGFQNLVAGYDIDNTLLDPQSELGSDEWFTWQSTLLPTAAGEPVGKG